MPSLFARTVRTWGLGPLSPQAHSSRRLAVAAGTVLATIGVLAAVTIQTRRAERALEQAASQTLRDYTGYAGRLMGGEVLRSAADQRARILAPVTGSAGRDMSPPPLGEIAARGEGYFAEFGPKSDPARAYFRLDLRTGVMEKRGALRDSFATRIADSLKAFVAATPPTGEPALMVFENDGAARSVAYACLLDQQRQPLAIYGYIYTRALGIAAAAERIFAETPLLPTSFTGPRWNYDTTRVRIGEVVNDSLLGMLITDREGRMLWQSKDAPAAAASPYRERSVLRTATGGIVVESALRPAGEPTLIPPIVRRAQRSSLGALVAMAVLLASVTLYALGRERLGAPARRAEAMQQLALGLRHELNNALASVMLNVDLLREERTLDDSQRERLEAVSEQADRMRGVLRRLEQSDRLNVVVPYLNEGFMVDLSAPHREHRAETADLSS